MMCERTRDTNTLARSGQLWESVVITMVGWKKSILLGKDSCSSFIIWRVTKLDIFTQSHSKDLMEEAKTSAIQSIEGRTIVYTAMGRCPVRWHYGYIPYTTIFVTLNLYIHLRTEFTF